MVEYHVYEFKFDNKIIWAVLKILIDDKNDDLTEKKLSIEDESYYFFIVTDDNNIKEKIKDSIKNYDPNLITGLLILKYKEKIYDNKLSFIYDKLNEKLKKYNPTKGGYYHKYLKYKQKYLKLKNKI
jgi:hypothetical protein